MVFDVHRLVQGHHRAGKHFQVRVVTLVVLGDGAAEPVQVAGACRLIRLLLGQRRIGRRLLTEPADDEVELDVHRLLAPQRAVVVEDRDTGLWRDEIRAFGGDAPHEVDDRRLRGSIGPRCEIRHASTAAARQELVELFDGVVDRERRRLLTRWKLLERLQELCGDRRPVEHEVDAIDQPVPVGVRRDVRALVRVGAKVEQLRCPQVG